MGKPSVQQPGAERRRANTARRNERIRAAFAQQYTQQPRPRKYTREYVVARLAERFCLSMATIEKLVLSKSSDS